jgi:hypothetical protein
MTFDMILMALFTGICGLTFIIGIYELVSGRMPGSRSAQRLGSYRWFSTPTRIRLASIAGLLFVIGFIVFSKPFLLIDLIAGGIGVLVGIFVSLSDARLYQ